MGHVLSENRHGLVVDASVSQATGTAEHDAALDLVGAIPGRHRIRRGADNNYDTRQFVASTRALYVTPHVTQNNTRRRSAIDGRTTRHGGYALSQRVREPIEEVMGWAKAIDPVRKTRFKGVDRVGFQWLLTLSGYNLIRMSNIAAEVPGWPSRGARGSYRNAKRGRVRMNRERSDRRNGHSRTVRRFRIDLNAGLHAISGRHSTAC